jgi:hypothetical protein
MDNYKWDVLGLAEVRWTGIDEVCTEDGHKLWTSGEDKKREKGVAFLVHKDTVKAVIECRPISGRTISIRLAATPRNITIIQVYAPPSDHDDNVIEEFYQQLDGIISTTPKNDILVVQGNWNAKMGLDAYSEWAGTTGKFGLGSTNDRGLRLLEFARYNDLVLANTLHDHKPSRRATWHAPNGIVRNQIDYILISKRVASGVITNKTRTFPGADIGSDHDLVMMSMKLKLKKQQKKSNCRIKFDVDKLRDTDILSEFQANIRGKFAPLLLLDDPQDLANEMMEKMNEAAEEVLGRKRSIKQPWVTAETLKLCDKRREKKPKRFDGDIQAQDYKQANNEVRRALRKSKEDWINKQCQTIENNLNHNKIKEAFATVKRLTGTYQPRTSVIEDKNGKMLTDTEAVADRWKEYCQELYSYTPVVDNNILGRLKNEQWQEEDPDITRDEVIRALSSLKHGKAAGIDNITGELLQNGGECTIDILLKICNAVWRTGDWPEQWTHSIIIPLPKKGNLKQCQNYRTISLISHASKILLRVILNRLQPQVNTHIAEEQAGFMAGRSTVEQILNLRILCEKYADHGRELHHNFIDFKKAFDRVWHDGLWAVMEKHNISKKITTIIKDLYKRSECSVLTGGVISGRFKATIGVRQGCPLSPCLFNLFLEQIMTDSLNNFEGSVSVGGRPINNLRFADDIDLIGGTNAELADLTARLDNTATAYGMEISAEKSKVLVMGTEVMQPAITVGGVNLENVESFKYLGATITKDGRSTSEIKIRIATATGALARLKNIWHCRNISIESKLRLMRAIVTSSILYGCEAWTLTAETEKRIQAFEFRCLRKILKIPYTAHRTNESVWNEITLLAGPQEHLLTTIKKRKMRWYGHINRSSGLANTIMQGPVDGKRGRGRPKLCWLDNIRKWTGKTVAELHRTAKDRRAWRETVCAAAQEVPLRPARTRDR